MLCWHLCLIVTILLMIAGDLQDDREILQAVEQELQQRRDRLQALEPDAAAQDGDQPMEPVGETPALVVSLLHCAWNFLVPTLAESCLNYMSALRDLEQLVVLHVNGGVSAFCD